MNELVFWQYWSVGWTIGGVIMIVMLAQALENIEFWKEEWRKEKFKHE